MSCTTTNDETPRICNYCGHAPDVQLDPQFGACEECYEDARADACWAADSRSTQDDDDSDRYGGGEWSGYEPPEVQ